MSDSLNIQTSLRAANIARQAEWDPSDKITLTYRLNELAGETGEACNVGKKIERERLGIRGSRALRAQPPAREDAKACYDCATDRPHRTSEACTHPAPDALRAAMEALEPFAAHPDFHAGDDWPVTFVNDEERAPGVTAGDFRRARQALAALQAEQKGGA